MILSFLNNKFVLHGELPGPQKVDIKHWQSAVDAFKTTNIKEAARFRKYADSSAQRIFNKLMLKSMPLPAGGLLFPPDKKLLPYQKDLGVPFILKQNRTYLAHEPGLGKTAQAIVAVNSKPGPTLIVVPAFLKTTWAREITKWSYQDFPIIKCVPESAKQFVFDWSADFLIASDAMLAKPWVMAALAKIKFKYIFLDEAHRFKNPEASRSVALFGGKIKTKQKTFVSRGLIYTAEHVCALSGTPMLAKPIELWSILYAMAPETIDFMKYHDFGFRYGGGFQDDRGHWHFTGSANEEELNGRIMGRFMHRLKKKDVLKDLPDKVREVIVMTEDPRHKDVKELDAKVCKQFAATNFEKPESLGEYALLAHETGLAKVPWVAGVVREYLNANEDESIILYGWHRDVVELLANHLALFQPMTINGGVKQDERTRMQDAFQSGRRRLIIGNISAMNLGLTLTRATRVLFAEFDWTPAQNEQAEDRAHRIGQKDCVLCQYIVLPGSMDELKFNSIFKKEDSIRKVIG